MRINATDLLLHLHKDLAPFIDTDLNWSVDNTPREVACYRLKESLVKKFNQEPLPSASAIKSALDKFLGVNDRMAVWQMELDYTWEEELVNEFRKEIHSFWYVDCVQTEPLVSNYNEIFLAGRTGPGASRLSTGTDMYRKLFCSPLSSTQGLADIWRTLISKNPQFTEAYSHPSASHGISVVGGNKISFVNKTVAVARPIAVEPTVNMWMQLGFGYHLEGRLRSRYGIDLSKQPEVNRLLATIGSSQNQLVTIDLESASDSISVRMLREFLPKSFFDFLMRLRSETTSLPDGSVVPLNMVSTMGNGFTFPLMTAIISAAVVATYRYLNVPIGRFGRWSQRNFAVFGDDIIVDRKVARHVILLLNKLGFVVNADKTFVEGPFRESCGVDVFLGTDVRPFFLKRLRTLQDAFVAINSANLWTAKTGVPLWNLVQFIRSRFAVTRYAVPPDEASDAGLHLPRCLLAYFRNKVTTGKFGAIPYRAFVPVFNGYRVLDYGIAPRRGLESIAFNPRGLELCFLAGNIRGYRVNVRQTDTRYISKRRHTPSWGYLLPQTLPGLTQSGREQAFVDACWSNLLA